MKSKRLATPVGLTGHCFDWLISCQTIRNEPLRINGLRSKLSNLSGAALLVSLVALPTPAHATLASWYDCVKPGECSRHKITASGERFNPNALTAAHRSLPFGTRVKVTHKGRSVIVRINDRGPFIRGRSLDLSRAAARRIGCGGVCRVKMTVIGKGRAR